jgi:hypothetical protein
MDYFGMSFVKRFQGISSRTPQEMDLVIGNPPVPGQEVQSELLVIYQGWSIFGNPDQIMNSISIGLLEVLPVLRANLELWLGDGTASGAFIGQFALVFI